MKEVNKKPTIQEVIRDLKKDTEALIALKFKGEQKVSVFKDLNVGDTLEINGSVHKLVLKEFGHYAFISRIPGDMDIQWHDWVEMVYIIEGEMGDKMQEGKIWKEGEVAKFNVDQKHWPYNTKKKKELKAFVHFRMPLDYEEETNFKENTG